MKDEERNAEKGSPWSFSSFILILHPSDAVRSRLLDVLIGLFLLLGTLTVYAPACRNGFDNFDDQDYVSENPQVLTGISLSNIRWAMTTNHAANWHPLTWLSLQLDSEIY